ncbi:3-deoxy-manno-octulosonate cytidylyltransferase [uncultured Rikenella sp.]|uniref:3-deoxy-manno-octulosonate cytidylyltransferase n=1 Tax=uncultured Rikenella sp. TaxID=368003 RepID=UPI00261402BC|nr:3-deoxy-manno-octulosonate cytidylyltransferase [uncultured Rikenella sp.]
MKYLALIPARYASTRFPGKPLADIHGKPMIQRVYERCRGVFGEPCYVATDDSRIERAVTAFGGKAIMTSTAHRSGTDRCAEALDTAERLTGERFDVVVNIQGDEPFIAVEQLEQIRRCFDDPATRIATLVKPFGPDEDIFNPNSPKVVLSTTGDALYFSRSPIPFLRGVPREEWHARHTYLKHIGLYAYRSDVLREITRLAPSTLEQAESLEQLRWIENGYPIRTAVTHAETHAIDTPEDLQRVLDLFPTDDTK